MFFIIKQRSLGRHQRHYDCPYSTHYDHHLYHHHHYRDHLYDHHLCVVVVIFSFFASLVFGFLPSLLYAFHAYFKKFIQYAFNIQFLFLLPCLSLSLPSLHSLPPPFHALLLSASSSSSSFSYFFLKAKVSTRPLESISFLDLWRLVKGGGAFGTVVRVCVAPPGDRMCVCV